MRTRQFLSELMSLAWQFVKRNGVSLSEALRVAWMNAKLKISMAVRIVKFYFQKVDGTMREAYGTLSGRIATAATGNESGTSRKKNDTVQVYFDTEKQEWRSFKKLNLVKIA